MVALRDVRGELRQEPWQQHRSVVKDRLVLAEDPPDADGPACLQVPRMEGGQVLRFRADADDDAVPGLSQDGFLDRLGELKGFRFPLLPGRFPKEDG